MVDAGLHHLIRAGKFENVKGFVFGTDVNLKENTIPEYVGSSLSIEEILDELIAPLGIPAIANVPVGHGKHMATIPLGVARPHRRRRQDARHRRTGRGVNPAIDRDFDAHLERVREFLRIPSVSADDGDLRSTAAAVCELIEAAGGHRRDRRAGRAAPDRDRRDRRPGPDRPALRHVRRPAARRGLDARAVRGRDRRRPHLRARRRQLEGRAGRQPARVRRRADSPCRQVLLMDGRGGARQPAAGRVLRRAPRRAARRLGARLRHARARRRQRAGGGRLQGPARARAARRRRRRRALLADRQRPRARLRPHARARRSCRRRSPPPT